MAMNGYSILMTWAKGERTSPQDVWTALSFAPGMDDLDLEDYHQLYDARNSPAEVERIATTLLVKYELRYRQLGRPSTAERWRERWLDTLE